MIATPAASHFSLAKDPLDAGKHVFVEKPLATRVAEVDELSRRAAERNLVVMTGHTFVYNSAVRHVKRLIDAGELGDLRYIYSQRLNLGRIRSDMTRSGTLLPTIQHHSILAWRSRTDFHWPPGYGLHAGRDRGRCFP